MFHWKHLKRQVGLLRGDDGRFSSGGKKIKYITLFFEQLVCLFYAAVVKCHSPLFTILCLGCSMWISSCTVSFTRIAASSPSCFASFPDHFCLCTDVCGWSSCFTLSVPVFFCSLTSRQCAEMGKRLGMLGCASRPCLSDHSFIWFFALANIFSHSFSPHFFFLSSCLCIFSPTFSFRSMPLCQTLHIHTDMSGLLWQVWCLSHAGRCNTSSPFDTLSLVVQITHLSASRRMLGSFHYEHRGDILN